MHSFVVKCLKTQKFAWCEAPTSHGSTESRPHMPLSDDALDRQLTSEQRASDRQWIAWLYVSTESGLSLCLSLCQPTEEGFS
ncbi:hypothetical protein Mal15_17830 [Stieleria maiorica]|uniref:Uncharacterized protein n=1 Tax=Stieleria maiorica TaxID=2795974 RepID=A0A5B9MB39_9BACT|nr:hypothetical protein Mal15_17830 [Stieleria maiorica]